MSCCPVVVRGAALQSRKKNDGRHSVSFLTGKFGQRNVRAAKADGCTIFKMHTVPGMVRPQEKFSPVRINMFESCGPTASTVRVPYDFHWKAGDTIDDVRGSLTLPNSPAPRTEVDRHDVWNF